MSKKHEIYIINRLIRTVGFLLVLDKLNRERCDRFLQVILKACYDYRDAL